MPTTRELELEMEKNGPRVAAMKMVKALWLNHIDAGCRKEGCDVKRTLEQLGDIVSYKLIDKPVTA